VLGHAGLAELEAFHQLSGGPLAGTQQVENLSAVRLGQGGVGAHAVILPDGNMNFRPRLGTVTLTVDNPAAGADAGNVVLDG
jgi:hypothetical protein